MAFLRSFATCLASSILFSWFTLYLCANFNVFFKDILDSLDNVVAGALFFV